MIDIIINLFFIQNINIYLFIDFIDFIDDFIDDFIE